MSNEARGADIAVIGMACTFPGARDLDAFWKNIFSGVDSITAVPAARWDAVHYDPTSTAPDRFYCRRGGFIDDDADFDAASFGIMPVAARGSEPDQLLMLATAVRALRDAGYENRAFSRTKTGVVLGRGNYASAGRTRLSDYVRTAEQIVVALRSLLPNVSETDLARVKDEFQKQLQPIGPESAIGLVPNLTASRIASRLDLHGPAFTVDAACASSLVAVDHACAELVSRRSDLMIAGGIHLCQDETFWSVFSQLGALSRGENIRPFDRRADGLLIGEGVGGIVLKRRADAEKDGDRVYAVIRGTGVASDGRGATPMVPRAEGQLLAMDRAWSAAGLDRDRVGLVEAHGTGTPTGDQVELESLRTFFGDGLGDGLGDGYRDASGARAVLGSVKSMIGHTMAAAGIAGLIKSILAIHHRVLPPSLHCEEPHAAIAAANFRVLGKAEAWESASPRCAAVSAFGFGGINAHVVVEEHDQNRTKAASVAIDLRASSAEPVAVYSAASRESLLSDLDRDRRRTDGGLHRLVIFDPNAERTARARDIVAKGRNWRGRDGIWFSADPLLSSGGTVAFLFPGVSTAFDPRVEDVAHHLAQPVPSFTTATDLEELGIGIVGVNRLLDRAVRALGIVPDVIAGHSIGEWSGMVSSGILSEPELDAFISTLKKGTLRVPGVVFAAAGCSAERAEIALHGLADIELSHDNCPHQVVFCGREASVDLALARLRDDGVLCEKLNFQSGFHSSLFADYVQPHRENFARLALGAPKAELFSATTCAPYPSDVAAIRTLAIDHLLRPVRFRQVIEKLHAEGVRAFIQVGTGTLVSFVEDTLRGSPHLAISANVKDRSGLAQLRRLAAAMFVEGGHVHWEKVAGFAIAERRGEKLALGIPLVRDFTPIFLIPEERPTAPALATPDVLDAFADEVPTGVSARVAHELHRVLHEVSSAGRAVVEALAQQPQKPKLAPRDLELEIALSTTTYPELLDHCFFRQPEGWMNETDRHPIVPMTASIEWMMSAAASLVPERVVVGIENMQALRWIVASKPSMISVRAQFDGVDRVHVVFDGYCEATVILAENYGDSPIAESRPLAHSAPSALPARALYTDRWMFHGPSYQGVVALDAIGDDGIVGTLEAKPAAGALLDNAGQLFGYWVMQKNETNRMALPVRIDRIDFFGPPAKPGERFSCDVRIRDQDERSVVADLTLAKNGRVWARISGWEDRRFDTDPRLWEVMLRPETNVLADTKPEGFALFSDVYRSASTRDQLARRYLGEAERAHYEEQGPKKQRAFLNGRIAAKDAVRSLLWKRGNRGIFPVEIEITNDAQGAPIASCAFERDVRISIAHKEDLAIAMATIGKRIGVDVERIAPRSAGFEEISFTEEELRLVDRDARDEWITRLWSAKESAAKARGTGLVGNPRRFVVRDRSGERLLVDDILVETRRHGDFILSWTVS